MSSIRRPVAVLATAVLLALVAGCGGGGGSVKRPGGTTPIPTNDPQAYKVVELVSGQVVNKPTAYDPTTAGATELVFRKVPGGTLTLGAGVGELGSGVDEVSTPVVMQPYYMAVSELTQAQWALLAGSADAAPWSSVSPAATVGSIAPDPRQPAYGLSLGTVTGAVSSYRGAHPTVKLRLPTGVEWEYACRGGKSTPYAWGAAETAAGDYAQVRETRGATLGPALVMSHKANAFGLFDMHGNVWEYVTDTGGLDGDAVLRGGSWNDNLLSARSANRQYVDSDVGYATAGVRLILDL